MAAYTRGAYKKEVKSFCECCGKAILGNAKKRFCDGGCRQKYARALAKKNK